MTGSPPGPTRDAAGAGGSALPEWTPASNRSGGSPRRTGPSYQHHHVLPLALHRRGQIGSFLRGLGAVGFRIEDARSNCLWLPAQEALAWHSGAALHRGPHPRYTDFVASRVERIRVRSAGSAGSDADDARAAVARLVRLQRALARALIGDGPRLVPLNRRDPMRLFDDYSYLDSAIAGLEALAMAERDLPPPFGGG